MSNLSYTFQQNALAAYKDEVRSSNSKSSDRLQTIAERSFKSQTHSSQSNSSHGNLQHEYHLKTSSHLGESTTSQLQQEDTKQKRSVDPYLAALTKETRGRTKQRYSVGENYMNSQ